MSYGLGEAFVDADPFGGVERHRDGAAKCHVL
jgi:hypothetical protein